MAVTQVCFFWFRPLDSIFDPQEYIGVPEDSSTGTEGTKDLNPGTNEGRTVAARRMGMPKGDGQQSERAGIRV